MKKFFISIMSLIVGISGYAVVEKTIEERVGTLESQVAELQSEVSLYHKEKRETTKDWEGESVTESMHPITKPMISTKPMTTTEPGEADGIQQQVDAFGFLWDTVDNVYYSESDPWQRQFGYNKYYDDLGGYVALWYDTVRVKFNYGGYDWLVQFWKGQYGFLLVGEEVGIYYKEEGSDLKDYKLADNMGIKVGFTCYNSGEQLFNRTYQETAWLTGFVSGKLDKYSDRSQMKMKIKITLSDVEMKNAFVEALHKDDVGFVQGNALDDDTYYTSGDDIYIMWKTDRNKTS